MQVVLWILTYLCSALMLWDIVLKFRIAPPGRDGMPDSSKKAMVSGEVLGTLISDKVAPSTETHPRSISANVVRSSACLRVAWHLHVLLRVRVRVCLVVMHLR